MNYSEVRSLPVPYRQWFIKRLTKQFSDEAQARKDASKSSRGDAPTRSQSIPVEEIMESIHEKSFKRG